MVKSCFVSVPHSIFSHHSRLIIDYGKRILCGTGCSIIYDGKSRRGCGRTSQTQSASARYTTMVKGDSIAFSYSGCAVARVCPWVRHLRRREDHLVEGARNLLEVVLRQPGAERPLVRRNHDPRRP
jgi:hypothetical protein